MKHEAVNRPPVCHVLVFPDENDRETIELAAINFMRSRCQQTRDSMKRIITDIMIRNNVRSWAFQEYRLVLEGADSVAVYNRTGRKRKKK